MESTDGPIDLGLTHVALTVSDMDASLAFWAEYASMHPVHERKGHGGQRVAWISDRTRPFVLVLLERHPDHLLAGWSHVGVGVGSRSEVDALLARAEAAGHHVLGPVDSGPPVGYWGMIQDPDGHNLELSHGQEVGFTVDSAHLTR
jgi:catechol 2,3-dioxygenase-like lactoylglutathione lyase family enzyme